MIKNWWKREAWANVSRKLPGSSNGGLASHVEHWNVPVAYGASLNDTVSDEGSKGFGRVIFDSFNPLGGVIVGFHFGGKALEKVAASIGIARSALLTLPAGRPLGRPLDL